MDAHDPRTNEHLPTVTPIRTSTSPSLHLEHLQSARNRGGIFMWLGLAGAFAWWIAAFGGMAALVGLDQLSEYSAAVVAAGSVALAIPGLMLIMAGLLARENARAASTNAVVLEAAARLLAPLETTGAEAGTFADQMKVSAHEVDRSMAHALSSMKAMSGEIADERQRLESVSYVAADNAKELSGRLGDERKALEILSADIRKQTELMGEAIPRQAAQMRDSARAAAADIAQADQALEVRLENLHSASSHLSEKVSSLDQMSIDAAKRSEELIFAVARMEQKLEESRKMVEQALRAGEMVAASAHTTGDKLTAAVSSALENARMASRDIQAEALDAADRAAKSLAALKAAGADASATMREVQAEAERRMPVPHSRPVTRGPSQPMLEDDDVFDEEDLGPARDYTAKNETGDETARDDSDLFEAGDDDEAGELAADTPMEAEPEADRHGAVNENVAAPEPAPESGPEPVHQRASEPTIETVRESEPVPFRRRANDRMPSYLKPVGGSQAVNLAAQEDVVDEEDEMEGFAETVEDEPDTIAEPEPEVHAPPQQQAESQQWRDIIADMERDEHATLPREENAEEVIHRLMDSGIRLGDIFRPRDKKKIANSARKGEGARRKAIVEAAARQVQRVQKRLDVDRQMMSMAREFLAMEEPDALMALDKTCHSSKNASPRLAAFLLIDAALG